MTSRKHFGSSAKQFAHAIARCSIGIDGGEYAAPTYFNGVFGGPDAAAIGVKFALGPVHR